MAKRSRRSKTPRPRGPYVRGERPVTAQPTTDATAQALCVGYRRKPWVGFG